MSFLFRCGQADFGRTREFGENRLDYLRSLALQMRTSITIKDRSQRGVVYPQCFKGFEAVDFLLAQNHAKDRPDAVKLCEELVEGGFMHHCKNQHGFLDTKSYFRFYIDESSAGGGLSLHSGSVASIFEAENAAKQRLNTSSTAEQELTAQKISPSPTPPKVTAAQASLADVAIGRLAYELRRAVPIHDRKVGLKLYKNCFVGSDAVSWMVRAGISRSRPQAELMAKRLVESKIIHHVTYDYNFRDGFYFYRFSCDETGASQRGPITTTVVSEKLGVDGSSMAPPPLVAGTSTSTSCGSNPIGDDDSTSAGFKASSVTGGENAESECELNAVEAEPARPTPDSSAVLDGESSTNPVMVPKLLISQRQQPLSVASTGGTAKLRSASLRDSNGAMASRWRFGAHVKANSAVMDVALGDDIEAAFLNGDIKGITRHLGRLRRRVLRQVNSEESDWNVVRSSPAKKQQRNSSDVIVRSRSTSCSSDGSSAKTTVSRSGGPSDTPSAKNTVAGDGVQVLRKGGDKGFVHPCLLARGVIRTPALEFVRTFLDFSTRQRWEPLFDGGHVVEDLSELTNPMRENGPKVSSGDNACVTPSSPALLSGCHFAHVWCKHAVKTGQIKAPRDSFRPFKFLWPRDICSLQDYSVADDGTHLILEISVKHPNAPNAEDKVRSEVFIVAHAVRQLPNESAAETRSESQDQDKNDDHLDGEERSVVTLLRQFDQHGNVKRWGWLTGGYGARDKRGARAAEKLEWLRIGADASAVDLNVGRSRSYESTGGSSALSSSSSAAVNKVELSDFELLAVVGRGGYGKVMQVRRVANDKIYAIKVLRKSDVEKRKQVGRTNTERLILAQVNHPFVVRLHYAFQSAEKLYMVLDYVPGGDIFTRLRRDGVFTESRSRLYACEVILALEHLHSLGIVYRDLKPENVLVDEQGHIKLTDFGLSRHHADATQILAAGLLEASLSDKSELEGEDDGERDSEESISDKSSEEVMKIRQISGSSDSSNAVREPDIQRRGIPIAANPRTPDNRKSFSPEFAPASAPAISHARSPEPTIDSIPSTPKRTLSAQQRESGYSRLKKQGRRPSEDALRQSNSFCGTELYMAPEMLLQKGHGAAVDWWCLGLLLCEMLCGRHPYRSKTHVQTLRNIVSPMYRPRLSPRISQDGRSLVLQLLHRDPKKRLGAGHHGAIAVKAHPFFTGSVTRAPESTAKSAATRGVDVDSNVSSATVDWGKILKREIVPEFKPELGSGLSDTTHFDDMFTREAPVDSVAKANPPTIDNKKAGFDRALDSMLSFFTFGLVQPSENLLLDKNTKGATKKKRKSRKHPWAKDNKKNESEEDAAITSDEESPFKGFTYVGPGLGEE